MDLGRGKFDSDFMLQVTRLLRLIALRRTKENIEGQLPPKREILLQVPLAPLQRECYEILLGKIDSHSWQQILQDKTDCNDIDSSTPATGGRCGALGNEADHISKRALKSLLVELRKCCCHPDLVTQNQCDDRDVIMASGKLIVLQKLVEELVVNRGKKLLIFSGFTKMLDVCQKVLSLYADKPGAFRTLRLDGSTSIARRNLATRLLNDSKSNYRAMLISTRAGGLGVTLTGATEVVMLDRSANYLSSQWLLGYI